MMMPPVILFPWSLDHRQLGTAFVMLLPLSVSEKANACPPTFVFGARDYEYLPAVKNKDDPRFQQARTDHPDSFDERLVSLIEFRRRPVPESDVPHQYQENRKAVVKVGATWLLDDAESDHWQSIRNLIVTSTSIYVNV
jgi:hypothetical protein